MPTESSQAKNILQIFASSSWGGGEQYVYELSGKLIENEYNVYLISRNSKEIRDKTRVLDRPLVNLPLKGCFDLFSAFQIKRIIEKYDIDTIHTHQFKDTFLAIFARIFSKKKVRIIFTRHLVKKAKKNFLYSFLYRETDQIIFISHLAKNEFLSSKPSIDPQKITVIHNSIVPQTLTDHKNPNLRDTYFIKPETTILAFTGRLVPEKGVEVLIEAIQRIQEIDFILFVVGKGDSRYEQELKDTVSAYGLSDKVVFTGFIDTISSFISQTDIGVLPSVCREAFGLAVIEFMQAGKAVITTDNGAQKEFITHNYDGILIPPSDSTSLASALRSLIQDQDMRIRLGRNATEKITRELSYETFFQKILHVYNETKAK